LVVRSHTLQPAPIHWRPHCVRRAVVVHEFPDDTLGIGYQHRLLARYDRQGMDLPPCRTDRIERIIADPAFRSRDPREEEKGDVARV
jgi:hypothetical protein